MIRSQIKKYPRKILSFGKRLIKKIHSLTGNDQDTHVHIQKQTSEHSDKKNPDKENSDITNNLSTPIQSHSTNEEVKMGSVQEDLQKEVLKQSKNVSEEITTEEQSKDEQSYSESESSTKTVVSLSSYEGSNPQKDENKSSLKTELLIDPEPTPNPNCYKFTLNTNIGRSFSCSPSENPTHHIGAPLLAIDGIVSVFGVNNFLVMNKEVNRNWDDLVEPVVEKIEEILG
jgi:hypothetical protein